jgi:hypothetical protein
MGIADFCKGELIDVVEWTDDDALQMLMHRPGNQ